MMRALLALAVLLGGISNATADLKPEQVAVLGMNSSAVSRRLAEEYMKARGIPADQVLWLPGNPVDELARDAWDAQIRPMIRQWLTEASRAGKIRCLVTTMDVPLKIGRRNDQLPSVKERKEFLERARSDRVVQIGGLLKLLDSLGSEKPPAERPAFKPDTPLAQLTATFDTALKDAQQRLQAQGGGEKQRPAAVLLDRVFITAGGINVLVRALANRGEKSPLSPDLARRLELLRGEFQGLQEGLQSLLNLADDTARDIQVLNVLQRAGGLLGALQWIDAEREVLQKNETYASFDSELSMVLWPSYPLFRWQPNWWHYSFDHVPPMARQMTLMVSRLAAPRPELAEQLFRTAIAVEKMGLTGKVYLDARGIEFQQKPDSRGSSGEYDQSLRDLAERLQRHTKLSVVLDNKPELFPLGSAPEAALYCGWYSLGKYIDAFKWVPGSVGYHMASMEAKTLTTPGDPVWCNAMLERGVDATLGPVYEPYLAAFPLPDDFFSLLLTGRLTLVETYYRTNPFNSWVMVLVGDPLYRPFKQNPPLGEDYLPDRLKSKPNSPVPVDGKR